MKDENKLDTVSAESSNEKTVDPEPVAENIEPEQKVSVETEPQLEKTTDVIDANEPVPTSVIPEKEDLEVTDTNDQGKDTEEKVDLEVAVSNVQEKSTEEQVDLQVSDSNNQVKCVVGEADLEVSDAKNQEKNEDENAVSDKETEEQAPVKDTNVVVADDSKSTADEQQKSEDAVEVC